MKQLPPKPGPDFKNLEPILVSAPMALETWLISAPVASQISEIELIDETLCAKNAFAASLESSLLQILVLIIFSSGTQFL